MRNPPAVEILNEEVSNLLRRKIRASLSRLDELSIAFDYEGEVTARDAQDMLQKIQHLHARALTAALVASRPERADALRLFAAKNSAPSAESGPVRGGPAFECLTWTCSSEQSAARSASSLPSRRPV
jgi:hypothetical protein